MAPRGSGLGHAAVRACGSAQQPRQLVTTTPRTIPLLKQLLADPVTVVTPRADSRPTPRTSRRRSSPRCTRRYGGHRARPAGARRRDRRRASPAPCGGATGSTSMRVAAAPELVRIVVARRSAGDGDASLGCVRHRRRRRRRGRPRLRARRPHACRAASRTYGRARRSPPITIIAPTASSPRSNQGGDLVVVGAAPDRRHGAGPQGARDARQVAARRAGGRPLRRRAAWRTSAASTGSRTRCASFGADGLSPAAAPTGSTRWCGR